MSDAKPYPKSSQLARGQRRYRRKIASPKQWQAIAAAKIGPCRVCGAAAYNGGAFPKVQLHHVVARDHYGDDLPENIVPLCLPCHEAVTNRRPIRQGGRNVNPCAELLLSLTDDEYRYMSERGGADYPERAYGVAYTRTAEAGA